MSDNMVWIGCQGCKDAGVLLGDVVREDQAASITVEYLHYRNSRGHGGFPSPIVAKGAHTLYVQPASPAGR